MVVVIMVEKTGRNNRLSENPKQALSYKFMWNTAFPQERMSKHKSFVAFIIQVWFCFNPKHLLNLLTVVTSLICLSAKSQRIGGVYLATR